MAVLLTSSGIQYSDSTVTTTKPFPVGANTIFCQAAAPTNWTRIQRDDDSMIRVVSTSGGITGGLHSISTGITGSRVASHTHTGPTNQNDSNHAHITSLTAHTHQNLRYVTATSGIIENNGSYGMSVFPSTQTYYNTALQYNSISVGNSPDHTHSGTVTGNPSASIWVPKYVDFIFCQKTS